MTGFRRHIFADILWSKKQYTRNVSQNFQILVDLELGLCAFCVKPTVKFFHLVWGLDDIFACSTTTPNCCITS